MDPDHSLRIAMTYAVSAAGHASAAAAVYVAAGPGGDLAVAEALADGAAAYGVLNKAANEADRFGQNPVAAAAATYKACAAAYKACAAAYRAVSVAYYAAAASEVPVAAPVADPVPVPVADPAADPPADAAAAADHPHFSFCVKLFL
ncbi:antifreeze protein Maxi-like [Zingiber officinale]|uniref:antifreeze protein Maxi-like n=1 Tax=Zingiber officinale TaxID=94328 RepID=UPI001C4B26E2|nr:antifreeze protein Maxi-like [Zingiber officinale]